MRISYHFTYAFAFFASFFCLFLAAAPPLTPPSCDIATPDHSRDLTLIDLLDIALKNNPETRIAWWNANRAASALGVAKSAYYPQVSLDASITNAREFKFVNGPKVDTTILSGELVFSLMLLDSGERAADVQATYQALAAAGWESEWSIQKIMAEVFQNGYSTLYAQEALEAQLVTLSDAQRMFEAADALCKAGLNATTDVYSSKAALAQIQMDVAQQKSQLRIEKAQLATTLGLPANTPLRIAPLEALVIPQGSLDALIDQAENKRQDLMAKRARLLESMAREKQTIARYQPSLSLYGSGGAQHALHDKTNTGSYLISVNFNAPLFTGFEATYQKHLAYADVKISSEELAQFELDIALQVLTQSSNLQAAVEMLNYADDNLSNAKAAYDGTLEKYNAGKEGIAEVSITLRQLSMARQRYSEIRSRYLVAIANLAFATGSLGYDLENKKPTQGRGLCIK